MHSETGGLRALFAAFGTAGLLVALTIAAALNCRDGGERCDDPPPVLSARVAASPWQDGDPFPLFSQLVPNLTPSSRVIEDERTGLVVANDVPEPPSVPTLPTVSLDDAAAHSPAAAAPALTPLPTRGPMVPTPLVDPAHRGMAPFYTALARGTGLARAAQWGDSTIAADGITGTVRTRLQQRFGYGGPGWIAAGLDPQWSFRPGLDTHRVGEWETKSILLGGGNGRYGFGGVVSTAPDGGYLTVRAPSGPDGAPRPLQHLELWLQAGAGHGSWWLSADGAGVGEGSASADNRDDRRHVVELPAGFTKAAFGANGGPVPFYGVVLETSGPGVVWDALGVVGVGTRSFNYFADGHLAAQVGQRAPELVVLMLGGNELGIPVLAKGDGMKYAPFYKETLRRLRAGAPQAGCLVVTPLDQGTREGGRPQTKPALSRLVGVQRKIAADEGCAFWDAFAAMGGEGSVVAWSRTKPPLAWADLLHLSAAGQDLVGQALADAIEAGFDDWRTTQGSP